MTIPQLAQIDQGLNQRAHGDLLRCSIKSARQIAGTALAFTIAEQCCLRKKTRPEEFTCYARAALLCPSLRVKDEWSYCAWPTQAKCSG
jgi:hypothetical protein